MPSRPKILVAYYSRTGNTERVARDIARLLGADIEKIIDKKKRTGILGYLFGGRDAMKKLPTEIGEIQKDPSEYDIVVLGTPVWSWNATPAITTYIARTMGHLKNAAFFITSGNTAPEKIVPYLEEISGKKALAYTGFTKNELKDAGVYGRKIEEFTNAISSK